ncbi:MAG: protoheme IX farnesyltransferase [Chloroflexi bacterium]|nr:protoheme IX farnesyltransferase [Chloroflexota bacterium]
MTFRVLRTRLRAYWTLIKSLQTGLLLVTGLAGHMSARCPLTTWQTLLAVAGSLFLAISGSTVLNMIYDRDIDLQMKRTCQRPLPSGLVTVSEALLLGLILAGMGVGWAVAMAPLYGLVVFAGLFFDVVVYTIWLKRRTPWSIVWGGIAGGMPILAGRVLGTGQIDLIGLFLALAVLLWIPTHVMTFSIKYAEDYRRAGVPVFPNTYGERITRLLLGLSTGAAVIAMLLAAWLSGLRWGYLYATLGLGVVLLGLALVSLLRASPKLNFALYKMASVYMLIAMVLIMVGV